MIKFFDQIQLRIIDEGSFYVNSYYSLAREHIDVYNDKFFDNIEHVWIHNGMIGLSAIVTTKFCDYTFDFYNESISVRYNMQYHVVSEENFVKLLLEIYKENIYAGENLVIVGKIFSMYREIFKSFNRENGIVYNGL